MSNDTPTLLARAVAREFDTPIPAGASSKERDAIRAADRIRWREALEAEFASSDWGPETRQFVWDHVYDRAKGEGRYGWIGAYEQFALFVDKLRDAQVKEARNP